MGFENALLYLKDLDTRSNRPLMLQPILFCPVLTWVCRELRGCGVRRFFVVCDEAWRASAQEALQDIEGVHFAASAEEALRAVEGGVAVVPGAVVPVKADGLRTVYAADAALLRARLEEGRPLSSCPAEASEVRPAGERFPTAFLPVADAAALQAAMPLCRDLINSRLALAGVTITDPAAVYIDPRCTVAPGVTVLPGTILRGHTSIGADCEIGPNAMLRDCTVGEGTTVNASQLNESTVGSHTTVGPFAYVRPNCTIGDHCRVGDFVEMKNSSIGNGTKISHLTYVGDSDVGERVNFGCGTVTTNYDGHRKFRCTIGDDVFIGCNTNLIAPVTLGDGCYTAAGSTVTADVPADALAIARQKQTNKDGWAARFRRSWGK